MDCQLTVSLTASLGHFLTTLYVTAVAKSCKRNCWSKKALPSLVVKIAQSLKSAAQKTKELQGNSSAFFNTIHLK